MPRKYNKTAIERALARKALAHFVRQSWHVLEPETDLVWNWHLDAICLHLEACTPYTNSKRGVPTRISRLLINIPPGHMKSLLVSVFWPAWVWLRCPGWRALFGSYDLGLSTRDSVRCRTVIQSEWYQQTFQPQWELKGDQNVKTWFENTRGGLRMALAVGGRGTGFRGHCIVFDDPLNIKQSPTDSELSQCDFWWHKRMSSRLNNPKEGVRVGIMQRLHEGDLSGKILERGGYEHLCLPTEYDPTKKCKTKIFEDPRTEPGELLFKGMYDGPVIQEVKSDLGTYAFEGQHNQNPVPRSGGIIKRHWLRYWYPSRTPPPPVEVILDDGSLFSCPQERLPEKLDYKVSSSDLAFKDKETNSLVAMQVWAVVGAKRFLIDQIHEHMSFVRSLQNFEIIRNRHTGIIAHLIEDKANGPAIMNLLKDDVPDMIPIEPKDFGGSKEARGEAASPSFESGVVYVPHPLFCEWAERYVQQLTTFPKSAASDMFDTTTQAINWIRRHGAPERKTEWLARL